MLFKLSFKNIRKSFKDYMIYFLTLILGVAIFYVFNALDSQQAMLAVSSSTKGIMKLMVSMLSGVSVGVAFVLGFLIIYANNFLIKRRKKEFAVYMTLGMGKSGVSKILFGETVMIGCISLGIGLLIGVFASQFMSILVAKMFEADMTAFVFTVSGDAVIKTMIYFGIMYLIVILFNTAMLSKYQLIDLLHAKRKVEKSRLKNSYFAVLVFLLASLFLSYAYYSVTIDYSRLSESKIMIMIGIGCVTTYLIFWSLSGFLLKLVQKAGRVYLRGLNAFILRQLNSNVNTSVFSMTIICLLFFVTICVLSAGFSVTSSLKKQLTALTPVDINIYKSLDWPEEGHTPEQIEDSGLSVSETLDRLGIDKELFKEDWVETTIYAAPEYTVEKFLGTFAEKAAAKFPRMIFSTVEDIMGISEYNMLAERYGLPVYILEEGKYIELCDFDDIAAIRNEALLAGTKVEIGNYTLEPQYTECQYGFVNISNLHSNSGITLVPDEVIEAELGKALGREKSFFAADYRAETREGKAKAEETILSIDGTQMAEAGLECDLDAMSKIAIYESSIGLATIATFIAIYLGIIFLIAGAALLALKELSESADNKERYQILHKIGVDKKMQNHALLWQMGIFFGFPMFLAVIHSIFGIQFAQNVLSVMYRKEDMIDMILVTAAILVLIYGIYFIATYTGCKRIIEER